MREQNCILKMVKSHICALFRRGWGLIRRFDSAKKRLRVEGAIFEPAPPYFDYSPSFTGQYLKVFLSLACVCPSFLDQNSARVVGVVVYLH